MLINRWDPTERKGEKIHCGVRKSRYENREQKEGLPSVEPVIGELKRKLNKGVRVQCLLLGEPFAERCESISCDLQIRRLAKINRSSEKSRDGGVQRGSHDYLH